MRLPTKLEFLLIPLMLLIASTGSAWSKDQVDIAMVLWRGITDAEEGFKARLEESDKYDFHFMIADAGQDKNKLAKIIEGVDPKKYKVIYAFGTIVTSELKKKFKDTPIVFNAVARPVEAGLIKTWEHSGNNVTGVSNAVPMASVFNTLSKVLRIKHLGFLYNPQEPQSVIQRDELDQLQKQYGYVFVPSAIETDQTIPAAIQNLTSAHVDAVLLPSDSLVKANGTKIVEALNKLKIPTIASIPDMVADNKAFIGLGPGYTELGIMAAEKTLAIVGGENPNNIASTTLERLHITVNLSTAKQIGISVPVQILRIATVIK